MVDAIAGYWCVLVWPDVVTCDRFDAPEGAAEHLAAAYLKAKGTGTADVRAYVFHGARVPVTGARERVLVLPDGRVLPIAPAAGPDPDDGGLLLAPADRRGGP